LPALCDVAPALRHCLAARLSLYPLRQPATACCSLPLPLSLGPAPPFRGPVPAPPADCGDFLPIDLGSILAHSPPFKPPCSMAVTHLPPAAAFHVCMLPPSSRKHGRSASFCRPCPLSLYKPPPDFLAAVGRCFLVCRPPPLACTFSCGRASLKTPSSFRGSAAASRPSFPEPLPPGVVAARALSMVACWVWAVHVECPSLVLLPSLFDLMRCEAQLHDLLLHIKSLL
jgi:hypothetical protein